MRAHCVEVTHGVEFGFGMGLPLFLGVGRALCVELTRGVKFGVGMGLPLYLGVGKAHCVELTCGVKFGNDMGLPLSLGVGRVQLVSAACLHCYPTLKGSSPLSVSFLFLPYALSLSSVFVEFEIKYLPRHVDPIVVGGFYFCDIAVSWSGRVETEMFWVGGVEAGMSQGCAV